MTELCCAEPYNVTLCWAVLCRAVLLNWLSVCARSETCGQLKVSLTAPGFEARPAHSHQPGNTTSYLDSASSPSAHSPAHSTRLRAAITTVPAPRKPGYKDASPVAHQAGPSKTPVALQADSCLEVPFDPLSRHSEGAKPVQDGAVWPHVAHNTCSPKTADVRAQTHDSTDELGVHEPVDGQASKLLLRTQMQQLSELSQLLSQGLTVRDSQMPDAGAEACKGKAEASTSPEDAEAMSSSTPLPEAEQALMSHHAKPETERGNVPVSPEGNIAAGKSLMHLFTKGLVGQSKCNQ